MSALPCRDGVCPQLQEAGSTAVGPAVPSGQGDKMMSFQVKIVYLYLSTMHGGSKSQSQYNKQHLCDYLTACENIFGIRLSQLARILFMHSPQQEKSPLVT